MPCPNVEPFDDLEELDLAALDALPTIPESSPVEWSFHKPATAPHPTLSAMDAFNRGLQPLHPTLSPIQAYRLNAIAEIERAKRREELAKVSANSNIPNPSQPQEPRGFAPDRPSATPLAPPHSPSALPSAPVRLHRPANENTPAGAWARLSEKLKLQSIGIAAENAGAISFRVTTSPSREAKLRKAAANGKNIKQVLADEFGRQCRRLGIAVPPLAFGIEDDPRLHAHGFTVPAEHSPAYFEKLRQAFTRAFGKVKGKEGSTQFWRNDQLFTPHRWVGYFTKMDWLVRRNLNLDSVIHVSRSMRQLGRDYHEAARKPAPASPAPVSAPARSPERPESVTSARSVISAGTHRPAAPSRSYGIPDRSGDVPPRSTSPPKSTSPPSRLFCYYSRHPEGNEMSNDPIRDEMAKACTTLADLKVLRRYDAMMKEHRAATVALVGEANAKALEAADAASEVNNS